MALKFRQLHPHFFAEAGPIDLREVHDEATLADIRAAYDALPEATKAQIANLRVHHSIAYSRQTLGFEFSPAELDKLQGAVHPLVRTIPGSGRKSLYLASHASKIIDWPLPDARLFLRDLMEHATQPQFRY